jgi:hypothetical protein
MDKIMVKAVEKTQYDVGCTWTLIFSSGITTATLLLLMHMHLIVAQSLAK